MGTHEGIRQRGIRMGRKQRQWAGEELRIARLAAGLSQRTVGRLVGLSHSAIGRLERGELQRVTVDRIAMVSAALGLVLRIGLFPSGSPVRDAAHLALIERLRKRVDPALRWRVEVPVQLPGDLRSADVVIDGRSIEAIVEAETRLADLQALERRVHIKQRDMGIGRVILLVSDTRHNRAVLGAHLELLERFPVSTRACLAALRDGRDPGGDAIVLL